jgi:hypothetical protein
VAFCARMPEILSCTGEVGPRNNGACTHEWTCLMNNEPTSKGYFKPHLLMLDFQSIGWWCWLMSAGLLTASVCGWTRGLLLAIGLTLFQLLYFTALTGSVRSFQVQVRSAYLLLLLVAVPQESRFLCWIPTIGTWIMVLFGYCALARTVSLAPWNRAAPMSLSLLRQTFLSAPVRGSFMQVCRCKPSTRTAGARQRVIPRTGA